MTDAHKYEKTLHPAELERRILLGLGCEWERALWVLDASARKRMRQPLFSLRSMTRKWGFWSGKKREMAISRELAFNHSWDSVREVLLHEMAHQLAEEVLGQRHGPPHGPLFRQACHLLRANPRASGNYRPLDERVRDEPLTAADRIALRVRKLLALAASCNSHEADAAMLKAHELIAKYHIDHLQRNEQRHYASIFAGKPALRHPREAYGLAHLLQDFYFVKGIWVPCFVLEKGKTGSVLEISGTLDHLRIAAYTHDFVERFIHVQWTEYSREKRLNRHRKTDFATGIIQGFREKLDSSPVFRDPDTRALVKHGDPLLKNYLAYRYPRTVMVRRNVSNQDEGVLRDGKEIGRNLIISRGITRENGPAGLLLDH